MQPEDKKLSVIHKGRALLRWLGVVMVGAGLLILDIILKNIV